MSNVSFEGAEEDPERVSHLTQCISHLQSHHVEFAHRCTQGLKQRISSLNDEAKSHSSSSSELSTLLSSVSNKQAAMQERVARALELQENLIERASILAQLHWSLPRPLSDEEKAMSLELDVAESKQATMIYSWNSIQKQLQAALDAKREARKQLQSGYQFHRGDQDPVHLPSSQASKVYSLVQDQLVQISQAVSEVRAMEQDIKAFKTSSYCS
jgi:phage FluMu gp28-like protein